MKIVNIYLGSKCVSVRSNKKSIIDSFKEEYSEYFKFHIEEKIKGTEIITIIENEVLYEKYKNREEIRNKKNENILKKDRNCIIVVNKVKKSIDVLCAQYGIIEEQYVGEILISIFGEFYEENGFYFFHASGVEKNKNSILMVGARNSGKTAIMSNLLQNGFNYMANSRIGINEKLDSIGQPYRLGMRMNTIYNLVSEECKTKIFNTEDYERVNKNLQLERFNGNKEAILKRYSDRKINLKNQDIKNVFDCKLQKKAKIKAIIIPEYSENIKKIEVKKLNENEKITVLIDNYESGIYSSVRFLKDLYGTNNRRIPNNVINNIEFYKVRQNENTNQELINWINEKVIGEK